MNTLKINFLKRFMILLVAFVMGACSYPQAGAPSVNGAGSRPILVQSGISSGPTATPFQPDAPTPTYLPTNFPTPRPSRIVLPTATLTPTPGAIWGDYEGPTVWPDIDIPAPVGILPQPEGQINIMLMGSDQRPDTYGFRTDTILLVTLNPKTGSVNITSFPRDLYVYIPGWTIQRINTAFPHNGFESLADTMEYNFGVRPDHYVVINFWSFKQVIDSLGGVDVSVSQYLTDQRDGHGDYTVSPGVHHMDGDTALWYVRARHTTSDFDRGRRQQEVIQAIFFKLLSLNAIKRGPELYDIYKKNVTTDLNLEDITPLLPMAANVTDGSMINHYFISPQVVTNFRTSQGAAVLLPNYEAILQIMRQALNSPE